MSPDTVSGIEYYTALAQLVASGLAVIAAGLAVLGIRSWGAEHIGKRRVELAESTLALFYEARDTMSAIRSPMGDTSESAEATRNDGESDAAFEARKMAYPTIKRFNDRHELFSQIHSTRYRFMALFGNAEAKPFEDLRMIVVDVQMASRRLAHLWNFSRRMSAEREEKQWEDVKKHEAVIWDSCSGDDPIRTRLDEVISDIEAQCRPIVEGRFRLGLWGGFRTLLDKVRRKG